MSPDFARHPLGEKTAPDDHCVIDSTSGFTSETRDPKGELFFFFFFFVFLGLYPWHTEVLRPGVKSEL